MATRSDLLTLTSRAGAPAAELLPRLRELLELAATLGRNGELEAAVAAATEGLHAAFDPAELHHLQRLAAPLAGAADTVRLEEELRRREETLAILGAASRELTSTLDREELLDRIADAVKRAVDYQLFTVLVWDEESRTLESIFTRRHDGCTSRKLGLRLGEGICGSAAALRRPLRVPDVTADPRFVSCGDAKVRSELTVPLLRHDRLIGVLDLESYRPDAFSETHERLLTTLASYVAIGLENARLYARAREDERRLAADLAAARKVHELLLPRTTPWIPGLETAVAYAPARHLGGDLYDVLPYGPGRTAIAVGDVAGKGTGSALYGALALGALRGYAAETHCPPGCVLAYLNAELRTLRIEHRFLALAVALFDSSGPTLTLANGGMPYPLLLRAGRLEELTLPGLPLGLLEEATHQERRIDLAAGDAVVFASDGITECLDAAGEMFGDERLRATLEELAEHPADAIADGVLAATDRHLAGATPSDDRTVLVLRVTG